MRLLFVCTGNLCRSPLAERLAVAKARSALTGSPELAEVHVSSAGLAATEGRVMDPHSAAALNALGGDADGFRARHYTRELAEAADLVLTMTRSQRHSVLKTTPRGLRRTFTLAEAAALLDHADLTGLPLLPLTERAHQLGLRLDAARAGRTPANSDDIDDPAGRRPAVHREVAGTIATALRPLADVLFASVRTQLPAPARV